MSDIIDKLRDDEQYYGEFGQKYLSNSDIGALLRNPRNFKKREPDNPAFAKGRYFHQLILEPEKAEGWVFAEMASRNSKAYKDFCLEHELEFALLDKEADDVRSCVRSMLGHMTLFDDIRHDQCEYEVPAVKEMAGEMWKGKADIVHPEMVIDLKTTADINSFKWSAKKYNYDSQAYIYQKLFDRPLVFYVVEKGSGMLGVFEPSPQFIEGGEAKVNRAVGVYRKFFGDNPTEDIESYLIHETL
jgi:hypothetical protein|tara:strand:+ start:2918 stop:3649 length:732 start_codon:yes stop_codon:yes gene_type:complete